MFREASYIEAEKIKNILGIYEAASGQQVNFKKSAIVFSKNITPAIRRQVADLLGIREVDQHDLYLRLPTAVGKSRKEVFGGLRDRVWTKLKGWKGKLLSKAGKEVLIKAVPHAVPTYATSVFRLPSSLCDEIEAIICRFLWGDGISD